jgi:ubiquinone/menaquinone biosynthesis C-methylase UbiE
MTAVGKFFDEFAKEYESQSRYKYLFYKWTIDHVIQQINKKKCKVLDMGTGNGESAIRIAAKLPGSKVIGLDVSKGMIAEAKKKVKKLGIKNVSFVVQPIEKLNVGKVDFAISTFAFHHVKDKDAVLSRLRRALPAGGRVIIGDYFKPCPRYKAEIRELRKVNRKRTKEFDKSLNALIKEISGEYHKRHPVEYPICQHDLKSALKKAGFRQQKILKMPIAKFAVVIGTK